MVGRNRREDEPSTADRRVHIAIGAVVKRLLFNERKQIYKDRGSDKSFVGAFDQDGLGRPVRPRGNFIDTERREHLV